MGPGQPILFIIYRLQLNKFEFNEVQFESLIPTGIISLYLAFFSTNNLHFLAFIFIALQDNSKSCHKDNLEKLGSHSSRTALNIYGQLFLTGTGLFPYLIIGQFFNHVRYWLFIKNAGGPENAALDYLSGLGNIKISRHVAE